MLADVQQGAEFVYDDAKRRIFAGRFAPKMSHYRKKIVKLALEMRFIDTHMHLSDEAYRGEEEAVLERALNSNVYKMMMATY